MSSVKILQSNYVLENLNRPIVITDSKGNEFRISVLSSGGIVVNKYEGEITVKPKVTNEIQVL